MAVAAVTTKPLHKPLQKKRLPLTAPVSGTSPTTMRLKAMRLAIALLDTGVHQPSSASNARIRTTAELLGIHPPSDTTCRMVRALIRYGR